MVSVKQILIFALAKIENGWTKGAYARDKNGDVVAFSGDTAVCFCPEGAIRAAIYSVYGEHRVSLELKIESCLRKSLKTLFINNDITPSWNDDPETTKEQVIQLFQHAINAAGA